MSLMMLKTAAEQALAAQYHRRARSHPGAEPFGLRAKAFGLIEERGLPHRRTKGDSWHYTDLRQLMRTAPEPAEPPSQTDASHPSRDFAAGLTTFAFLNGWLTNVPTLPPGVEVTRLADVLNGHHPQLAARLGEAVDLSQDPVAALNTAFVADGLVIRIHAGVLVEQPLHFAFETVLTGPAATSARLLVLVEEGAAVTIAESHNGPSDVAYHTNMMLEFVLAAESRAEHVRINGAGREALALSTLAVSMAERAVFDSFSMVLPGGVSRHSVFVRVHGDDAKLGLRGTNLLCGQQHADTTLVVDHAALGGESREIFKTVVEDSATGVFQGKIIVRPGAQKTDGRMASNALLLSDDATMNNKPELEIFADDVQCAHGATIGALDESLLFYLMARGLPKTEAESLLIQAFLGEAIEGVAHEGMREALIGMVASWLSGRGQAGTGHGI